MHAGLLHAKQHRRERQIDLGIHARDVGLLNLFAQRRRKRMNRRSRRRQRRRRALAVARGHVGQRLRRVRGIQRIRKQHGIVHRAAQRHAESVQHVQRQLPIVHALGHGCIFKQRAQFGRQRQAQRAGRSAQTPTLERVFLSAASNTSSSDGAGGALIVRFLR